MNDQSKKKTKRWLFIVTGILLYFGVLIFCMRYYTEPYRIEITADTQHMILETGGMEHKIQVCITNQTPEPLSGKANINYAYRIFDTNGTLVLEGKHYPLKEVKKRASITTELVIQAPLKKGFYTVKIDLVEEGVTWFEDRKKGKICELTMEVKQDYQPDIQADLECNSKLVQKQEELLYIPVKITNVGTVPIQNAGQTAVLLSYHIKTLEGEILLYDGERTPLPEEIPPGESLEVVCKINFANYLLPQGTYLIEIELLQEGIAWGSGFGIEPVTIEVNW